PSLPNPSPLPSPASPPLLTYIAVIALCLPPHPVPSFLLGSAHPPLFCRFPNTHSPDAGHDVLSRPRFVLEYKLPRAIIWSK
ncbi:hypothetical protein B0H13DRAFT_2680161, partial [Mycena leptocephala]